MVTTEDPRRCELPYAQACSRASPTRPFGRRSLGLEIRARAGRAIRGVDPALVPLRGALVGEGCAAGEGADRPGEVLYLGGDHEELARRALRHLGERPEVEEPQGFGGEIRALEPLEEAAGHLDLGALDVAVGRGLALGPQDSRLALALG